MRGTILQNSLIILITSLMMLMIMGCPQQTTQQPAPQSADTPPEQIEQPEQPEQPEMPTEGIPGGVYGEVLANFFMAFAEGDFETAKTWCTESFYESDVKPMEEAWEQMPDEAKARMREDLTVDEEMRASLMDAEVEVSGEEATMTIVEEEGATTVFGFKQVDGEWKLNSVE